MVEFKNLREAIKQLIIDINKTRSQLSCVVELFNNGINYKFHPTIKFWLNDIEKFLNHIHVNTLVFDKIISEQEERENNVKKL